MVANHFIENDISLLIIKQQSATFTIRKQQKAQLHDNNYNVYYQNIAEIEAKGTIANNKDFDARNLYLLYYKLH